MSCTPGQLVSLCAYYLFSFHPLLPFPVCSEFISVFVIHLLPASLFLLRGLGTAGPRCVCPSPFFSVLLWFRLWCWILLCRIVKALEGLPFGLAVHLKMFWHNLFCLMLSHFPKKLLLWWKESMSVSFLDSHSGEGCGLTCKQAMAAVHRGSF